MMIRNDPSFRSGRELAVRWAKSNARRLPQRLLMRPIVLAYHRVATLPRDPLLLAVSPRRFADHLQILSRLAVPTPLTELARTIMDRRPARGAVVITFDDGYVDNLIEARPLLEENEVPATVFVTTGSSGGELWWDRVERLVLAPPTLPPMLRLEFGSVVREWSLDLDPADDGSWNVLESPRSARQALFVELQALLRDLRPDIRDAKLDELAAWSTSSSPPSLSNRSLTDSEVSQLAAGGLVVIGAHTVGHAVLSALPREIQRTEIERSRRSLAELLGRAPSTFAYPFGGLAHFTQQTVEILRETGFSAACTTVPGTISRRTDPLTIPRFLVRDWDGDEFERRFRSLFCD
jgi:peptidoglycan/xylan/chitin deacetylase (PgdA/CDA1 family)